MLDGAFGLYIWMPEYGSNLYGRRFPEEESCEYQQRMSKWGYSAKGHRKSQSLFVSLACEYSVNADYVRVVNIRGTYDFGRVVPIIHSSAGPACRKGRYGMCDPS